MGKAEAMLFFVPFFFFSPYFFKRLIRFLFQDNNKKKSAIILGRLVCQDLLLMGDERTILRK